MCCDSPGRERAWWLNSMASEAQTMNDVSITDGDRGDIPLGSLRYLLRGDAEATPRLSLTFTRPIRGPKYDPVIVNVPVRFIVAGVAREIPDGN
jgi:hypothetical protein